MKVKETDIMVFNQNNMSSSLFSRHIVLSLIILSSCSSYRETKSDILQIDFHKAEKRKFINASEVISNIEYVALETYSQCLIGESVKISVSENFILLFSGYDCFLFSRNGKFIRRIGQKGSGPAEYRDYTYRVKIDEKSGMVYLMSSSEIYAYSISGEFVKKLNLNELRNTVDISRPLPNITHWKENLFCANIDLNPGKEPYRCIIFTLDGEVVKLFPNYIIFNYDFKGIFSTNYNREANIYCYNEQLFFREILCDTLFRITDQLEFMPEIVFELPGKKIPINKRGQFAEILSDNTIQPKNTPDYVIHYLYEVDKYLFLTGKELCLYNKNSKKIISFEPDPFLQKEITVTINNSTVSRTTNLSGFRNDIDGGLPFSPSTSIHIQNNHQMACVYQSYLLKELLTEEHFARYEVKDQEAHKRLRSLLANLDEEDNPVIMIATFK